MVPNNALDHYVDWFDSPRKAHSTSSHIRMIVIKRKKERKDEGQKATKRKRGIKKEKEIENWKERKSKEKERKTGRKRDSKR